MQGSRPGSRALNLASPPVTLRPSWSLYPYPHRGGRFIGARDCWL